VLGANTTAVQMAAPVWKLLDQPSYKWCMVVVECWTNRFQL